MIHYFTRHLIIRYIISGGISATVNICLFSLLFYKFHIQYLLANALSFIVAFFVSLLLQKFWTFKDTNTENIHIQGLYYLMSSLFGLAINTLVLYICVDFFGFWKIPAVIVAGIATALCTFQISKKYIFNQTQV